MGSIKERFMDFVHRSALPAPALPNGLEVTFDALKSAGYTVTAGMEAWGRRAMPPIVFGYVEPEMPFGPASGSLVYAHGNAETLLHEQLIERLRALANRTSRRVYAVEYCGYDCERSLRALSATNAERHGVEWLVEQDIIFPVRACVTFAESERRSLGYERGVVICGYSVGSCAAIHAAPALRSDAPGGGLLLVAPMLTAAHAVIPEPFAFVANPVAAYIGHFDNRHLLKHVACPTFCAHGKRDAAVRPHNSARVLEEIPTPPGRKMLVLYDNVDHSDIAMPGFHGAIAHEAQGFFDSVYKE